MSGNKVADYQQFFRRTIHGDLWVDPEIMNHRQELGRQGLWQLLKIFTAGINKPASQKIIREFENDISPVYKERYYFNTRRFAFYLALVERDGEFCQKCGTKEDLTVDHIVPLSRGGENELSNLQLLCRHHNQAKGAK